MKETIYFEDITALKNVLPIIIGVILCVLFAFLILNNEASLIYIALGVAGIALLGIPQIKNIRRSNTIKYNNTGLTAKLLGIKTFGFQFQDLEQHEFTKEYFILKVKGMDEVTLSRKHFQEDSLQQLYTLIQQKTAQL